MNWPNWSEFFAMGGYGPYVWGSFAMCALVLVIELGLLAARRRAALEPERLGAPDQGGVGASS